MADERIMPPPLPDVVPDAGGWTSGSVVAEAVGTAAAGSIGSEALLEAVGLSVGVKAMVRWKISGAV
jgi:hypothetical protein